MGHVMRHPELGLCIVWGGSNHITLEHRTENIRKAKEHSIEDRTARDILVKHGAEPVSGSPPVMCDRVSDNGQSLRQRPPPFVIDKTLPMQYEICNVYPEFHNDHLPVWYDLSEILPNDSACSKISY